MRKININHPIKLSLPLIISSILIFSYSFTGVYENKARTEKYKLDNSWPNLPDGFVLGQVTGVGIDTSQNVLLFHRADRKWTTPFPSSTISSPDIDGEGNVYVADRENNRIQKFDFSGNFIFEWKNPEAKQLYSLTINKSSNALFAIDYLTISDTIIKGSDILFFDSKNKLDKRIGRSGGYKGHVCRYHDIAVDKIGNIYVGDILGNKI